MGKACCPRSAAWGTRTYTYDAADRLTSVTAPGGVVTAYPYDAQTSPTKGPYWSHHDGLGSVTDVTSPSGTSLWWMEYTPFGTPRASASTSQAPVNLFRFTGAYLDQVSGLYHPRARQYDPALGRFLSVDPLAGPITDPAVGAYAYVRDNPCRYVDPSGLAVEKVTSGACPPAIVAATLGLIFVGPVDALVGLANIVALPSVIAELALLPADVAAVYATGYLTSIVQQAMRRPCEAIRLENPLNPFGG